MPCRVFMDGLGCETFHAEAEREIGSKLTTVSVNLHSDRTYIIVTQLGTIAAVVQVTPNIPEGNYGETVYGTRVCFGLDSAHHHLFARFLAEKLKPVKPLTISLALTDFTPAAVRSVVDFVVEIHDQLKSTS